MPISFFQPKVSNQQFASRVQLLRGCRQPVLLVLALVIFWTSLAAQTQVNLAKQGKNADFSEFVTTRPWRLMSALPGSCQIGEAVFVTTAVIGQQLHFCGANNSWTVYSTTPIQAADLLDFAPLKTGAAELTAGPFCSAGRPCRARFGGKLISLTSPAVVNLSGASSTGTLLLWLDQQGMRAATTTGTGVISCNGSCSVVSGATSTFPAGSLPIAAVTYVANVFALVSGAMDQRAILAAQQVSAGPSTNLVVTLNSASGASEVDLSETLDFGGLVATRVLKRGLAANRPVNCALGDLYHQTDGAAAGIYLCRATNQWRGPLARRDETAMVENRVTNTAVTGDAGPVTVIAASHTAGIYRVCAVVTVTTGAAGSPMDLALSWRSPAGGTDLTQTLLSVPVATPGEGQACQLVRTTGESAIAVDATTAGSAAYTATFTAERLL